MIPFLDLRQLNVRDEAALVEAFTRVLRSGWYVLGQELDGFEQSFAEYCASNYCIGVGTGLDALSLILAGYASLGRLSPGAEVILPANTFIATALAVSQAGLTPVLVEPSESTGNIDPSCVEAAITPATGAIVAVHLYGRLAEMDRLRELASHHQLLLIEDAAQAHGARDQSGVPAGALGDAAAFSFFPVKNLGAMGDAGAVVTSDQALAERIAMLRNYGASAKYVHEYKGGNSRLDELQAALLRVKIGRLESDFLQRNAIAERYLNQIVNASIRLPLNPSFRGEHAWHLFVVRCEQPVRLQQHLSEAGVQTLIHYPIPIHRQKAYSELASYSLPRAERLAGEVLSLPLYPGMADDDVGTVIEACNRFRAE